MTKMTIPFNALDARKMSYISGNNTENIMIRIFEGIYKQAELGKIVLDLDSLGIEDLLMRNEHIYPRQEPIIKILNANWYEVAVRARITYCCIKGNTKYFLEVSW